MRTIRGLVPPTLRTPEARLPTPRRTSRTAVALLALAVAGLGLAIVGRVLAPPRAPAAPPPPVTTTEALPRGDIPLIGDPVRDLTIWYSDRVSDANKAALENLRGRFLSPLDPLSDQSTTDLYGTMLLVTIPLLTMGGLALGYLIMTSATSGESAYAARSVTPRFVVATTLAILGIFLVSVLAQFVTALDAAMIGVSLPGHAVGGPDAWPAGGGVFTVLQNGGFDPRVGQGPDNWNDGAWLSVGLLAGVLVTCLQMLAWVLGGVERLLVLIGPLCLAAYALPATERVTTLWFRALVAVLAVRFAWTIAFVLFSLQALPHIGAGGSPPTLADTNLLLGLATGAAAMMLGLPLLVLPVAIGGTGVVSVPVSVSRLGTLQAAR